MDLTVVGVLALAVVVCVFGVVAAAAAQLSRVARGEASAASLVVLVELGSALLLVAAGMFLLALPTSWITLLTGIAFIGVGVRFGIEVRRKLRNS